MPDAPQTLSDLREARAARDESRQRSQAARLDLLSLKRKAGRVGRGGDQAAGHDHEIQFELARETAVRLGREEAEARDRVNALAEDWLGTRTSEELTALWSADTPIMLLPLRIETRLRLDTLSRQIWVRVFPDVVAIETHEETLAVSEDADGQEYWSKLAVAADETARKEAWRKLAERIGGPRASFVIRRTRPLNWGDAASVAANGLLFPVQAVLKQDGWTEAPRVRVMPDRLELLLLRAGKVIRRMTGRPIPDIVHAGPAPIQIDGNPSWQRDPLNGRLLFDDDSLWLTDFDRAIADGLGFRVPLSQGEDENFDELIVIGLKHSADSDDGADLVSSLLAGHRFSTKGLALVPQGSATNNTSDEDASLDSVDWFADASYAAMTQGQAAAAAVPEPGLDEASDGFRLAHYLGLDPALFHGVPNADRHDHAEAVAMNRALFPGTLGYYLRSMIPEAVSETALDALHQFFTRSVTGRGPLAAIRVGSQPYGLLLAGAAPLDRIPKAGTNAVNSVPFERGVEALLARLRPYWASFVPGLARVGGSPDASADLLAVLGLQPTSAEYFQRIGATLDHLSNFAAFQTGGDHLQDEWDTLFAGFAADVFLQNLGYTQYRQTGAQKPYPLLFQLIYQRHENRIPPTSLIDGLPFSEADQIKPYDAAGTLNYIDWLAANAHNADILRRQDFGGAARPTALLYMLMRHALLIQSSLSISNWFGSYGIETPELVASRKFVNFGSEREATAWEIMATPTIALRGAPDSDLSPMAQIYLPRYRLDPAIGAPVAELLDAYGVLKGLPTARLERLFAEHLDTLSYRIDAWETALTDRRLGRRRAPLAAGGAARGGVYIGAVGYLENLGKDRQIRFPIDESELPAALQDGSGPLFTPFQSPGFLHLPSLNHATAGAILRNGYLTHATPDDPDRLAVDLSSRRVRRAKELLDGVRNNQPLEVLTGVEFERALHDATTRLVDPVVLNDLKPIFRAAFPILRTRMPPAGSADGEPEIVPDYAVVNGLAIAATPDSFPAGVADLPALDAARTDELKAIRRRVQESLDALKDIVTTESAYQLALGNFDRAAAIIQSLATAAAPPEIEVIRSARGTDLVFTQRLALQLDPNSNANPWPAAMGARADMEPVLNAWLGTLLPGPDAIACRVTLKEGAATDTVAVTAADLGIQPIDLLAIARRASGSAGPVELETRVRDAALGLTGRTAAAEVVIAFADPAGVANAKSFAEVLSILDLAHQIVASARPLDGRDTLTASNPLAPGTEPSGLDVAELRGRLTVLADRFAEVRDDLQEAVTAAEAPTAGAAELADLALKLRAAADAGVPFAFPLPGDDALLGQAKSVDAALEAALVRAAALEDDSNAVGLAPPQQADLLIRSAQEYLGADFRVLPLFAFPNAADLAAAEAARDSILTVARAGAADADPVGETITSVAQVRGAVHRVHRLRLMHELATGGVLEAAALQLPPRADDVWLAGPLPAGWEMFNDTLSLIQLRPQAFNPAGKQCGLLIDEWVESLPRKTEVTGLAFGFDQPDSAPLQAIMLAVADEDAQQWDWDALVGIVRETVTRAKLRAVEPDKLDTVSGLTTLLPATLAEFSTSLGGLSLDFGLASPSIYAAALQIGYVVEGD